MTLENSSNSISYLSNTKMPVMPTSGVSKNLYWDFDPQCLVELTVPYQLRSLSLITKNVEVQYSWNSIKQLEWEASNGFMVRN